MKLTSEEKKANEKVVESMMKALNFIPLHQLEDALFEIEDFQGTQDLVNVVTAMKKVIEIRKQEEEEY